MSIRTEVKSVKKALMKKYKNDLVSILQFGSSLDPKRMFQDSDLDFIIIAKRAKKDFSLGDELREYGCDVSHELNLHIYSTQEFFQELQAGHPIALMARKFGRILFDDGFLSKLGKDWQATELTSQTWRNNGWRVWSRAIMDYFSGDDCCYLRDCHHAARTFTRLYILKKHGKLAETDSDIINSLEKELGRMYEIVIKWRRDHTYKLDFRIFDKIKDLSAEDTKPLLVTEQILDQVVKSLENKQIYTLAETIRKIPQPYEYISSVHIWQENYHVGVVKSNKKLEFLEFPLFK